MKLTRPHGRSVWGDWTYGSSGSKYDGATRASDFILQYLPVFAKVTGDERWTKVYDRTNAIVTDMVDTYGTGLLPDFLIPDGSGGYQRHRKIIWRM